MNVDESVTRPLDCHLSFRQFKLSLLQNNADFDSKPPTARMTHIPALLCIVQSTLVMSHYVLLCRCFTVLLQEFVTISVNHNCILHYLHSLVLFSSERQVWPLTQFFLFPFCKKYLICLEGKLMTPHWENTILFHTFQQLPHLRLGPLKSFLS